MAQVKTPRYMRETQRETTTTLTTSESESLLLHVRSTITSHGSRAWLHAEPGINLEHHYSKLAAGPPRLDSSLD
eukprot:6029698-Amphidinium_carterae.1